MICFVSPAFAQHRYQITQIPSAQGANSAALGINNKNEIVGYSFLGEDYQAFFYSFLDQSLADVGSFGGKINAACAINDAGQVTGYSQDGTGNLKAFVFSRKQPITSLGTFDAASTSEAFGINISGAVVGDRQSGAQPHRLVLFSKARFKISSLPVQTSLMPWRLLLRSTTRVRSWAGIAPAIMRFTPFRFSTVIRPTSAR